MDNSILNKKIEYWKNELLDTGKRNKMINFKETNRATLKLIEPGFEELFEQIVANNKTLTFQRPVDEDTDIRVYDLMNLFNRLSSPVDVALGDIRTTKTFSDAKTSLRHLRNKSKLALEEQGINILYLCFGFIEWKEKNNKSGDWIRSPLILVPVSILVESVKAPYKLKKTDDDVVVNPTLAHLFLDNYGIKLPSIDSDPEMKDLKSFISEIEQLVSNKGWKFVKETQIGLMSFLKINMYNDIVNNEEMLKDNLIIRAFSGESNDINNEALLTNAGLNRKSSDIYQVVNADSSQQEAIELSKQGASFVLQGPPGTGKSQTITNIISEGLADGKKILFVSEKMAALEVVYKRLKEVNLADFCLPLHDHKANKKDILKQIGNNLSLNKFRVSDGEVAKLTRLDIIKNKLDEYVGDIHTPISPMENSLYEVYGIISSLDDLPFIPLKLENINTYSKEDVYKLSLLVSSYDNAKNNLGERWYKNPWNKVTVGVLSNNQKEQLYHNLLMSSDALDKFNNTEFGDNNLSEIIDFENISKYHDLGNMIDNCNTIPSHWINKSLNEEKELLHTLDNLSENIKVKSDVLSSKYNESYFDLDADSLINSIQTSFSYFNSSFNIFKKDNMIHNRNDIKEKMEELLKELLEIKDLSNNIDVKYGFSSINNIEQLKSILESINLIDDKYRYTEKYFNSYELNNLEKLLEDLKTRIEELLLSKKIIDKNYLETAYTHNSVEKYINDLEINMDYIIDNCNCSNFNEREDIINKVNKTKEETDKLISLLSNEVFEEAKTKYNIEFPKNINEIENYKQSLQYILDNFEFNDKWKNESDRKYAVELIEKAMSKDNELNQNINTFLKLAEQLSINLDVNSLNFDYVQLFEHTVAPFEEAERIINYRNEKDVYVLLENIKENKKNLSNIYQQISDKKNNYRFKSSLSNDDLINIIINVYNDLEKLSPNEVWLEYNIQIRELIGSLKQSSLELQNIYNEITKVCDTRIFELECTSILDRFKTEYTSFFKIFNKNYKQDCNSVKVTFKDVRKVKDQEIIDLLQKLNNYNNKIEQYKKKYSDINMYFNIGEYDIWYDWNALENTLNHFLHLCNTLIIPEQCIELFNNGSLKEVYNLSKEYKKLCKWFDNKLAEEYYGVLYKGVYTDVDYILHQYKKAIELYPYFTNEEMFIKQMGELYDFKVFENLRNTLNCITSTRKWFIDNKLEIQTYLSIDYNEGLTKWDVTYDYIKKCKVIIDTLGEESFQSLTENNIFNYEYVRDLYSKLSQLLNAKNVWNELYPNKLNNLNFADNTLKDNIYHLKFKLDYLSRVLDIYDKLDEIRREKITNQSINDILLELKELYIYQCIEKELNKNYTQYVKLLGSNYMGVDTNWEILFSQIDTAKTIIEKLEYNIPTQFIYEVTSNVVEVDRNQVSKGLDLYNKYIEMYKILGLSQTLSTLINIQNVSELLNHINIVNSNLDLIENCANSTYSYDELLNELKLLDEVHKLQQHYTQNLSNASVLLPLFDTSYNADWKNNIYELSKVINIKRYIEEENLNKDIVLSIVDNNDINRSNYLDIFNNFILYKGKLESFINMFENNNQLRTINISKLKAKVDACINQFNTLDSWIDFRNCRNECYENGLKDFIDSSVDYDYIVSGKMNKVFEKNFYHEWLDAVIPGIESVSNFISRVQNERVNEFNELDSYQLPLAQMRIREKLIRDMPTKTSSKSRGEIAKLLHELDKRSKIMPLRKLFREIPNLLLKLKPCLMMSPLSVSYFLESQIYQFDMVIFDEASQIFPQDAIGAIARGKQVIITGDSKQLPPTNFFKATSNKDGDFDDEEDYDEVISDSILEEASVHLSNRSLLWHYRSKNEDLITFSNKQIYNNNLITFPSSEVSVADHGVEYCYVKNGVYTERSNIEEAKMCLKLVIEHIEKYPSRSLGIIAFSEKQQSIIEDTIQKYRMKNSKHESFFTENKEEPFFVKNLENVQGDERDTIIFSICYGKDPRGTLRYNFGPLSRQGGERRLNVAITRAKINVKLVGSLLPEEIDPKRTTTDGAKFLREYIKFAIQGSKGMFVNKDTSLEDKDIFVENVSAFLKGSGYIVENYVGNSDYKIDIAIKHPTIEGKYIVGIECDGLSYLSGKTTRDRDHLRKSMLESMGWNIYRVWSTEWIKNPKNEKANIIHFIQTALGNKKIDVVEKRENQSIKLENLSLKDLESDKSIIDDIPLYKLGSWRNSGYGKVSGYYNRIAVAVKAIISVEQPMHVDLLYKRMAGYFGNEKVSKTVVDDVESAIRECLKSDIKRDGEFIYLKNMKDVPLRKSRLGSPDRMIENIHPKEIMKAIILVTETYIGIDIKEIITEVGNIFGYKQVGPKMRTTFDNVFNLMIKDGIINIIDDKVVMIDKSMLTANNNNNKSDKQNITKGESKTEFSDGEYVVGDTIPEGEYILVNKSNRSYGVIDVSKNLDEFNNYNYKTSYSMSRTTIVLSIGEYIRIRDGYLVKNDKTTNNIQSSGNSGNIVSKKMLKTDVRSGTYEVGTDIKEGEYKIFLNSNKSYGDVTVYRDLDDLNGDFEDRSIIIYNTSFIDLSYGEYIRIKDVRLRHIEELSLINDTNNQIHSGTYKVGKEVLPGEYKVFIDSEKSYGELRAYNDVDDLNNDYIDREIDLYSSDDSFSYITLLENEFVTLENCYMIHESKITNHNNKWFESGLYKVGLDISAGEYKFICSNDTIYGGINIYNDLDEIHDDIPSRTIDVDYISFIKLNEGEYVKVDDCKFIHITELPVYDKGKKITNGIYKVGNELFTGIYQLYSEDGSIYGSAEVYTTIDDLHSGNWDRGCSSNVDGEIELNEGEYVIVSNGYIVFKTIDSTENTEDRINPGKYEIGTDLKPGLYKACAIDTSIKSIIRKYKSKKHNSVDNLYFVERMLYITFSKGEYINAQNCYLVLIKKSD